LFPAIKLTLLFMLFFMGIYSMVILGIAQLAPNRGHGFMLEVNGNNYYENIAQPFSEDQYFWSRPSAVHYNAAGSGGSNKGPSNPDYLASVQARIDTFLVHNPDARKADIPSDMVTASGSGQDPNISVQGALVQIPRIAKARNISVDQVKTLVNQNIEKPLMGLFGTEKINVLKLNIALNQFKY
ncbi:MAG TPA: K(+)-transporting ATPase subunit C, partial [Saprospiraceae bacterium]|nr:K(+)-transporting ATPase subunit C [Saprospiraceae bacterium]